MLFFTAWNEYLEIERQIMFVVFQVSHLAALLTDLESLIEKKLSYKCQGNEAEISCHQRKIDLEVKFVFLNLVFIILCFSIGWPTPDQAGIRAGREEIEAGGDGVQTEAGPTSGTAEQGERERLAG